MDKTYVYTFRLLWIACGIVSLWFVTDAHFDTTKYVIATCLFGIADIIYSKQLEVEEKIDRLNKD